MQAPKRDEGGNAGCERDGGYDDASTALESSSTNQPTSQVPKNQSEESTLASSHCLLEHRQQGTDIRPATQGRTSTSTSSQSSTRPEDAEEDPTPLQFVNYDAGQRPRSPSVRRAVREHVMREFHARRRQQRVAARANTYRPLRILQSPVHDARSTSISAPSGDTLNRRANEEQQITAPSTNLASQPVSQRISESVATIEHLASRSSIVYNILDPQVSEIFLYNSESGPSTGSSSGAASPVFIRQQMNFDRWQYDTGTPWANYLVDGAPILFMDSRRWPYVQRIGGATPAVSVWMPELMVSIPDARSGRPCLLKSSHTGDTIKWINDRLASNTLGVSDVTIGVIMCLTHWEVTRNNASEADHHLRGLERIITLRGGFQNISDEKQFRSKLALLDLLSFTICGTQTHWHLPSTPRPRPPLLAHGLTHPPILDSPLAGDQILNSLLEDPPFPPITINLLQIMRDLVVFGPNREMKILPFGQQPNLISEILSGPPPYTTSPHTPQIAALSATIHLTSIIYTGALLTPPVPFSSQSNQQVLNELITYLESPLNDETWARYPGILLWILLTAITAAKNRPERGFLVMFLLRIGLGVGIRMGAWDAIRDAMRRFAWIRQRVEGGMLAD